MQLLNFGQSTILSYTYESVIYKDDMGEQRLDIEGLDLEDRRFFRETMKLGGDLILPCFKSIRASIHKMGESQQLLAKFLLQSSVVMIQQYREQIGKEFREVKKQRKIVKEQLQEKQSRYTKA